MEPGQSAIETNDGSIPRLTLSHETPPTSSHDFDFDNGNTFSVTLTTPDNLEKLVLPDHTSANSLDQVLLSNGHTLITNVNGNAITTGLPGIEATDPFAWSHDDHMTSYEHHMTSHDQVLPRNLEVHLEITRGHALSTIEEGQSDEHSSQSSQDSEAEYVRLDTIRTYMPLPQSPSHTPPTITTRHVAIGVGQGEGFRTMEVDDLQSDYENPADLLDSIPLIGSSSSEASPSESPNKLTPEGGAPGDQGANETSKVEEKMRRPLDDEADGGRNNEASSRLQAERGREGDGDLEEDSAADSEDEYIRLSEVVVGVPQPQTSYVSPTIELHKADQTAHSEENKDEQSASHMQENEELEVRQSHSQESEVPGEADEMETASSEHVADRNETLSPDIMVSDTGNGITEVAESNHENMGTSVPDPSTTDASNPVQPESNLDKPVQQESNLDKPESNLDASDLDSGLRSSNNTQATTTTTSQQTGLQILQPLSPQRGNGLNEQYEHLRRTLSHSRRRYSARGRNPRELARLVRESREARAGGGGGGGDELASGDLPHAGVDSPSRRNTHSVSPYHQHHQQQQQDRQKRTIGQLRDITSSTEMARSEQQSSEEAMEPHVDQHGRTYYMDHSTHTIAFNGRGGEGEGTRRPRQDEMQTRRQMLDRRYQSLQRSFRGQRSDRHPAAARDRTQRGSTSSPAHAVDNQSLTLTLAEAEAMFRHHTVTSSSTPNASSRPGKIKKQRSNSGRAGRWFFGRKSSKTITQQGTVSTEDEVLTVMSPPPPPVESPSSSARSSRESSTVRSRSSGSADSDNTTPAGVGVAVGVVSSAGEEGVAEQTTEVTVEEPRQTGTETAQGASTSSETPIPTAEASPSSNIQAEQQASTEQTESEATLRENVTLAISDTTRSDPIARGSDLTSMDQSAAMRARSRSQQRRSSQAAPDTDEDTNQESSSRQDRSSMVRTREGTPPTVPEESSAASGQDEVFDKVEKRKSVHILSEGLSVSPAMRFLTRKDLYTFLSAAGEPGEKFLNNRGLMELVQRIRSDNRLLDKYQHSRQLVSAFNSFADIHADMPERWEKKINKQGKVFFIDHTYHITTFIDPRLPFPNQEFTYTTTSAPISRRVQSFSEDEPTVRSHHTTVQSSPAAVSPPSTPVSPAPSEQATPTNQLSYEEQVVVFFQQSDVEEQISARYQRGVRPPLREMITTIRTHGTTALERIQMSGNIATYELALVLSLFEEDIGRIQSPPSSVEAEQSPPPQSPQQQQQQTPGTPTVVVAQGPQTPGDKSKLTTLQRKKQAFSSKLQNFKMMLARLGFAQSSRLKFNIRRTHLLEDAYEHMMKSEIRHLQRKRLNIAFQGEDGLDYGGPSREFFFLLSREIFNPYYGLFEYAATDTYTVQISPTACFIQNNQEWFRFAGRIIALVIAQGFLLDVFFTRTVYKLILGRAPSLKDLESLEPAFYNSLVWILENDPEPLDLTFTVEEEAFGQLSTHPLKPGGDDIPVTEENKQEYVDFMIKWRMDRGVAKQLMSMKKGFAEVMPITLLQGFDAQELEFIIAGTLEIDVDDWKEHTEYRNGYHATHQLVLWFWQAINVFDNEQRLRLLQFVTGTSSVPFEGFKALRGSNGPKRFTIDYFNDLQAFPRTHTCFNRIDIPPYPSFEVLFEKLSFAIEEGGTFGIE